MIIKCQLEADETRCGSFSSIKWVDVWRERQLGKHAEKSQAHISSRILLSDSKWNINVGWSSLADEYNGRPITWWMICIVFSLKQRLNTSHVPRAVYGLFNLIIKPCLTITFSSTALSEDKVSVAQQLINREIKLEDALYPGSFGFVLFLSRYRIAVIYLSMVIDSSRWAYILRGLKSKGIVHRPPALIILTTCHLSQILWAHIIQESTGTTIQSKAPYLLSANPFNVQQQPNKINDYLVSSWKYYWR